MKIEFFWAMLLVFISFHFGTQFQLMFFCFAITCSLLVIIDFYKTSENPHPSFEQSSIGSLRHPVTGCDLVTFKNMNNILVMRLLWKVLWLGNVEWLSHRFAWDCAHLSWQSCTLLSEDVGHCFVIGYWSLVIFCVREQLCCSSWLYWRWKW